MQNKTEFYNSLVQLTKNTGQGLQDIFATTVTNQETIDELIEEGHIKSVTMYNSYLPDEIWYCLTGIYCVEETDKRSLGGYSFMRHFFGFGDNGLPGSDITNADVVHANMDKYKQWVFDNMEGLEAIKRLEEKELNPTQMNDETIEFLKSKQWYVENLSISECLNKSKKKGEDHIEVISINNKLLGLYGDDPKYGDDKVKALSDIEKFTKQGKMRRKFNSLMELCDDKSMTVQEYFNTILEVV
jgi:hypothetical protein